MSCMSSTSFSAVLLVWRWGMQTRQLHRVWSGRLPASRVACRMLTREYSSAPEGREVMVDVDRGRSHLWSAPRVICWSWGGPAELPDLGGWIRLLYSSDGLLYSRVWASPEGSVSMDEAIFFSQDMSRRADSRGPSLGNASSSWKYNSCFCRGIWGPSHCGH